jgi:hypothetical protein
MFSSYQLATAPLSSGRSHAFRSTRHDNLPRICARSQWKWKVAALWRGVHLNANVRGGVIRGISDLLDGKTDADKAGSQQRAANHGAFFFDSGTPNRGGQADLHLATELFQNGEVWCVSDVLIIRERSFRPGWIPLPLIPAYVSEITFHRTAHQAVRFAIKQISVASPVQIEFGLVGVRGVHFGVPRLDNWGRIQGDEVVVQRRLATAGAGEVDAALLEFFLEVFDQTGQERPADLHNFPPGPLQPPGDYIEESPSRSTLRSPECGLPNTSRFGDPAAFYRLSTL